MLTTFNYESPREAAVYPLLDIPLVNDDAMHVVLVTLSAILVAISVNGYNRRRDRRYFFLMLAFIFFFLDQAVTLYQQLYLNDVLIVIPYVELHLVHTFELVMSICFIVALLLPTTEYGRV